MNDCVHHWSNVWFNKTDKGERVWGRKCFLCKRIEKTKAVRLNQRAGEIRGCLVQEEEPDFRKLIANYQGEGFYDNGKKD